VTGGRNGEEWAGAWPNGGLGGDLGGGFRAGLSIVGAPGCGEDGGL